MAWLIIELNTKELIKSTLDRWDYQPLMMMIIKKLQLNTHIEGFII